MALTNTVSQVLNLITTGSTAVLTHQIVNDEPSNSPITIAAIAVATTSATAQAAGMYLKQKSIRFPKAAALWATLEVAAGAAAGAYVALAKDGEGDACGTSMTCLEGNLAAKVATFTAVGLSVTGMIGAAVVPKPDNTYMSIQ